MWYKLDIIKLGFQLLPPILRSKVLVALLKAMLRGIRDLYNRFYSYRSHVLNRLNITAGVQYIEKILMMPSFFQNIKFTSSLLIREYRLFYISRVKV